MEEKRMIRFLKRVLRRRKEITALVTLFFFTFGLIAPGIAKADQPVGLQMTFSGAGTTYSYDPGYLSVALASDQQLDSTSVIMKLDGQVVNSSFAYKGHEELINEGYDTVWVVDSYLEGTVSVWGTSLSLKDGPHTLSVTAADISGVPKTTDWNFNVAIVPILFNPVPANGVITKETTTGFSVKVNDNDGINESSINITLDNNTVPASFNPATRIISYVPTTGLSDGLHTINVTVADTAGNQSSYTWSYTIKTDGPTLDLVQKNQTLSSNPNLTVNLSSIVNLSDSGFTFKLDGQPVNAQFQFKGHWETDYWGDDYWVVDDYKQGTLTFAGGIRDGIHTVEVTAKDYLGNENTQNWSFNLAIKPEFSEPSPANGVQTLNNTGFSVKVIDPNDGFAGDSSFIVKLNGNLVNAQYSSSTNILSYNPQSGLADGDYTVNVIATDIAGTESEYTWTFTVKTAAPIITFAGNGQTFFTVPSLLFSLQSLNTISANGFSMSIDGKPVTNFSFSYKGHYEYDYDEWGYPIATWVIDSYTEGNLGYTPHTLINGNHTVTLSAKDVLGNTSTIQGTFTKAATQTLAITSPANNATVNSVVNLTASTNLDKMNMSVKQQGTNQLKNLGDKTGTSGTWSWDTTKVSDGEYILILTGYDSLGNSVTTQQNVKVANVQSGMGISHWGTVENAWGNVNIANGNFVVSQPDIQLSGRGLGTEFSRVYNSQLKTNGVLGWGWRINVPELAQFSDGSVIITSGDGTKYTYTLNADGTYNRPVGSYEILTKNADNSFELKFKDGKKFVFDVANSKVILKDKNGNSVIYQYDSSNKLISITDPSGRVTTLTYNTTTGKLTSVRDYASRTWTYLYDANSNLIRVTDPLSKYVIFAYDSNHQLTSVTDANGKVTGFTYSFGKLTAMSDPLNNTTGYSYDSTTSSFVETNPKGNTTKWVYDTNWHITSVTDARNNTSSFTYDNNFNVTSKADFMNKKTTFTYDSMGNLLSETDPMSHAITYAYDQNNNLLSKSDAMGTVGTYTYDDKGNLLTDGESTNTYNSDGTIAKVVDAKGNATTFSYDAFGNMLSITDAAGKTTQSSYNSIGKKLTEKDASENITTYTYDTLGRMLTVTVPDGANPPKTTTYTYDANGNRLTLRDAAGNVTTWTYDALNRMISLTEPGNKISSKAYDANGNVVSETAQDGKVTTYTYDVLNRLTGVNYADGRNVTYNYDANNNKTRMADSNGTTIIYEYNADNLLIKETSSTGKIITYDYNERHQVTGKTVDGVSGTGLSMSYHYDGRNLSSLVANNVTTNFSYDANSNRTSVSYANNTDINYGYDSTNKLTSVTNHGTTGNTLSSYNYTYYDNGQIKTVTDSKGITTYEYDGQNRLAKIIDPTGKVTDYTFDEVGNRKTVANTVGGVTTTETYNYDPVTNQLNSVQKPDGSTVTYTYDTNGNTLTKTDSTGTTSYEYNSNNQLTKVTKPNGDVIEFAYNGENQRVSKSVNGVVIKYEYDNDLVYAETDATGNVLTTYVYDDKGMPISMTKGSQIYNFLYNGHGDVVALTDASGAVVSTYDYDVWGNVAAKTGTVDSLFGYAGQFGYVSDKETGLYFLKSRYYDPEIGRFTTRDRFKGFENRPASQNQYTYCENDPVNQIDPSGYFSWYYIGLGVYYIASGIWSIVRMCQWGIMRAMYGAIFSRFLLFLSDSAIVLLGLQQYGGVIFMVTSIIAMTWNLKTLVTSLPKGLDYLRKGLGW
jgi:RHS repeat-associated protein